LQIGAAVGALLGLFEVHVLGWSPSPVILELAGMGALFAAVARVPITATVVVFEMTSDFNMLLPLMISSITAFFVAEKLSPGSLYDRLLELQGFSIEEPDESDPLSLVKVRDVMRKKIDTVDAKMSFNDLMGKFRSSSHKAFPVIENGQLVGIVTQIDILTKRDMIDHDACAKDVMTPSVVRTSPDVLLCDSILVLDEHALSRLPVVDETGKLVGMISRYDIIKALANKSVKSKREPKD